MNFKAEYGPPNYDFTHDFTTSWVYPIPFFRDGSEAAKLALGNWTFGGIFLFQSGFAVSTWNDNGNAGLDYRPDQVSKPSRIGKVGEWFNTAAFVEPGNGLYGDARNGNIRGPSQTAVNTSLYKTCLLYTSFLSPRRMTSQDSMQPVPCRLELLFSRHFPLTP